MEKNTAILIADLSGYTALTEAHGASTAADTVDRYQRIVFASLVGRSILYESVGDEILIVSHSADDVIETAILLYKNCIKENNFLLLHGGLHYGKLLKHNNQYFGSPINQASRIAAKANKGTLWCSSSFIDALSDSSPYSFNSKGSPEFKNVNEPIEVFEMTLANQLPYHVDPVCRMIIHDRSNAIAHPDNDNILFCSTHCLNTSLKQSIGRNAKVAYQVLSVNDI